MMSSPVLFDLFHPDMLSFQKKKMWDSARRLACTQQFSRVWRTRDIYITVNKKNQFKGMIWITVLSSVNIKIFALL